MITAIREVRRAKKMTLDDVAKRCDPPTTPQTIGRLETGARTVSLAWLNRIAAAMEVEAAELVTTPEVPIVAVLKRDGVEEPEEPETAATLAAREDLVAVRVGARIGDYRPGDILWCVRLAPEAVASARHKDVLVASRYGEFVFGRLIKTKTREVVVTLPGGKKDRWITGPAWIARVEALVRTY